MNEWNNNSSVRLCVRVPSPALRQMCVACLMPRWWRQPVHVLMTATTKAITSTQPWLRWPLSGVNSCPTFASPSRPYRLHVWAPGGERWGHAWLRLNVLYKLLLLASREPPLAMLWAISTFPLHVWLWEGGRCGAPPACVAVNASRVSMYFLVSADAVFLDHCIISKTEVDKLSLCLSVYLSIYPSNSYLICITIVVAMVSKTTCLILLSVYLSDTFIRSSIVIWALPYSIPFVLDLQFSV